jgi:hypothetical protein
VRRFSNLFTSTRDGDRGVAWSRRQLESWSSTSDRCKLHDIVASDSVSKGGDIEVLSGSGDFISGKITIASNAAKLGSTSGDILINSGLSSGGDKSGAGKCYIDHFGDAMFNLDHHVQRVHFSTVVISTGNTTASTAGTVLCKGGASRQGQGGNVDIRGGQSTDAGARGSATLGTLM